MAGIVGSAVASEAVRRLSSLLSGEEGRDRDTTEIKVDRIEMAVLKLETVIAMSEDWQITRAPLLRWKAKLKRVLKEGKGIVRTHRRNNTTLERMRSNSLPRRMAQVAMRFMPFSRGSTSDADDDLTDSAVRQFERIAEGADEYLEFVRCGGGRPRILTFLPSFARSVAAGERTEFLLRMEGGTAMMLLQPWWLEIEGGDGDRMKASGAGLLMSYEHDVVLDRNFMVMAGFRTSEEDVDAKRIATNCVVLLPPQFSASCVAAMMELVAGMDSHGRNSPAVSAMYACFVRAVKDSVKTLHLTEALMTRRTDERQRIWEAHLPDKTMDWAKAQS